MHSGQAQPGRVTAPFRIAGSELPTTGVQASCSDSIRRDSRTALTPICSEARQTEQRTRGNANTPNDRSQLNTEPFPFWIQPVAAVSESPLRQLKLVYIGPEKGGTGMATSNRFSASLLYGVFSGFAQTQDALSMAKPEV